MFTLPPRGMTAFLGIPDSGKTLGMTWNALLINAFKSNMKIYANYNLKVIDYIHISSIEEIDDMYDAYFFGDELWSWADCRESKQAKNKMISKILLASGKRNVQVYYTAQKLNTMERRIRENTQWYVVPELLNTIRVPGYVSPRGEDEFNLYCKLYWYRMMGGSPHNMYAGNRPDLIQEFFTPLVMGMYDTREEIKDVKKRN